MTRILMIGLLTTVVTSAQNLQLHYDLRREHMTSTFEMFKPDRRGATFWFIDLDYNDTQGCRNASLAYFEIARYWSLPGIKNTAVTLQYNDGLTNAFSFNPIWLAGFQYGFTIGPLFLPFDLLARKELDTKGLTFQLTTSWFKPLGRFEMTGFLDLWSTGRDAFPSRRWVLLSEPQLWFRITDHIKVGGELEISYNFSGAYTKTDLFETGRLFLLPTIGAKWHF